MKPLSLLSVALFLALCGCRPTPPPTERQPEPQAQASARDDAKATQMRDAIQAPLDKAKSVQDTAQQAAETQRAAIDAATAQ